MDGECKVQLDATVDTQPAKPTHGVQLSSKLSTALLVLMVCLTSAAAAVLVFNSHATVPGSDKDSFEIHHALRQISNVRAAIHLEGKYNSARDDSVEWMNQVDQSHSQGQLKLEDNEIVIPHNGLYFVYSQASFRVRCSYSVDEEESGSMVHLSHTVKRWSKSYGNDGAQRPYQTMLHSVRTACRQTGGTEQDEQGNWFSAIYMGAVFNLNKGDRLATVMEKRNLPNVEDDAGKTYFGVFAL